jgi:DNA-binding NarL/FixJ family response regulator
LIVDPNEATRNALSALINSTSTLRLAGAHANARTVIRELPKLKSKPDVAVVDAELPGISGANCVRGMKALLPQLRILMLVTTTDEGMLVRCLAAGASAWEQKSSTPTSILSAIRKVVQDGATLQPDAANLAHKFLRRMYLYLDGPERLTHLQRDVALLEAFGLSRKQTAAALSISEGTVQTHRANVYRKLNVHNRDQLRAAVFNLR